MIEGGVLMFVCLVNENVLHYICKMDLFEEYRIFIWNSLNSVKSLLLGNVSKY